MTKKNTDTTRRDFLKASGTAAVIVSVSGCSSQESGDNNNSRGDNTNSDGTRVTLTYSRGNDSGSLDPQSTPSGEDIKVTRQIFDTLLRFKPGTTKLISSLATEWSIDGKNVSITLRKGVKFHNGDIFTADDFIASYRRFVDDDYKYFAGKGYTSSYGDLALGNWISSIKKDGDHGLKITLNRQYAPFLSWLGTFATSVIPKSVIKKMGSNQKQLSQNPVGSGPFKFDKWNTGNKQIRLTANNNWWGNGPHVDELVFTTISENTTRAQTLDTGDADIIDGIGAQAKQLVKSSSNAELLATPGVNTGYMGLNLGNVKQFRDKRVRQAINYAVNTKAIVNTVFNGIAVQSSQPIPSDVLGYNKKLDPYPYNPNKATQLLKDAGVSDFSFELAIFKNPRVYIPSPVQAAQTIKSNLSKVGIDVSINQMEFNAFLDYTINKGKSEAFFLGQESDNGDPDNFYYQLLHPGVSPDKIPDGQNYVPFKLVKNSPTYAVGLWANKKFMKLVSEAQSTTDTKKRAEEYRKAAVIAHDEAPWLFLSHAKKFAGIHNGVSGYKISGGPGGPALYPVKKGRRQESN